MHGLGEWKGVDPASGFHLVQASDGRTLKVVDLVDDSDPARRSRVLAALKDPAQKNNRDHVDVIIALTMATAAVSLKLSKSLAAPPVMPRARSARALPT